MKINHKLLITTSLIAIMSVSSINYAAIPNMVNTNVTYEKIFQDDMKISVEKQLDINKLLTEDLSIKENFTKPQVLVINAHPQETYKDNQGSVVDIGIELEKVLEENYKVSVLHYIAPNSANANISGAYERIEPIVKKILKENPSIEVIIDVHRDGGIKPTATLINDKSTAKINIINGLSIDESSEKIGSLKIYPNAYIEENLSFSTQIKYTSDEQVSGLISNVILKPFRYSLHMAPKSLLIDIGNNNDTLEEATNAVYPFVDVLAEVLRLEKVNKLYVD